MPEQVPISANDLAGPKMLFISKVTQYVIRALPSSLFSLLNLKITKKTL